MVRNFFYKIQKINEDGAVIAEEESELFNKFKAVELTAMNIKNNLSDQEKEQTKIQIYEIHGDNKPILIETL